LNCFFWKVRPSRTSIDGLTVNGSTVNKLMVDHSISHDSMASLRFQGVAVYGMVTGTGGLVIRME
jgi:hypothetical protein